MKKTLLILACFFLCLSETRADAPYIYSGNPENPSFLKFDDSNKKSEYKSTLLTYFCDYSNALMHAPVYAIVFFMRTSRESLRMK